MTKRIKRLYYRMLRDYYVGKLLSGMPEFSETPVNREYLFKLADAMIKIAKTQSHDRPDTTK